jgi:hypothetical protein
MKKSLLFTALIPSLFFAKIYSTETIKPQELIKKTKQPSIKFVCTAAIIPNNYDNRKQQYIKSLLLLKGHGIDAYLIESCQKGPTFLDEYCNHVCYSHTQNPRYLNYGINEALSLISGLKFFGFDPDDTVIKFTGRYSLESDEFVQLVKNNADADAIVRSWDEGNAYTALFAIKLKYFLDFLENNIDYEEMHQKSTPFEYFFGAYITKMRKRGAKIVYLPRVYDYLPIWTPHR